MKNNLSLILLSLFMLTVLLFSACDTGTSGTTQTQETEDSTNSEEDNGNSSEEENEEEEDNSETETPTYTLSFNANGGSGDMDSLSLTEGVAGPLPVCGFSRDEYTFMGWAEYATGSAEYADQEDFTIGSENTTLFAVWSNGVYVGGSYDNTEGISVAYVQNGTCRTILSEGSTDADVLDIWVDGSDVYAVGYIKNLGGYKLATCWKNGAATYLTDGTDQARATAIFISGSDIYIAGTVRHVDNSTGLRYNGAVYWKNGTVYEIPYQEGYSSFAESIYVVGDDVYLGGYEFGDKARAFYWKNGSRRAMGSSSYSTYGNSIWVEGSYVYLLGNQRDSSGTTQAYYWKQEMGQTVSEKIEISSGSGSSNGLDICVDGSDIYMAGYESDSAKYWKNEESVVSLSSGSFNSYAFSICLDGSDVYIAGYDRNDEGKDVATFWKNGSAVELFDGRFHSRGKAIFVIEE